jgi:hypothetical protein
MNELLTAIIGCLPLVLMIALIAVGVSRLNAKLFPKNPLLRRFIKSTMRLVFVEPFKTSYTAIRWICTTGVTTNPDYRTRQLYLENYPVTPLELYAGIEAAFEARQIVGVELSRVSRLEWHLFSTRRIYLLIRFRDATCFVGAAPVGNGLLVSWRYSIWPGRFWMVIFQIPYFGVLTERVIATPTFHRTDAYFAFEQAVRICVTEATDTLTDRGVRPLAEDEHQPLLREFYG